MNCTRSLHILPLAVGLILFSTAIPIELRSPQWSTGELSSGDFAVNVVLYMPLGWALRRRSTWQVLLCGLVLSAVIEISQAWGFERFPSFFDVAANAAGAVAGAYLARWVQHAGRRPRETLGINRWVMVACAIGIILPLADWLTAPSVNALRSWDTSYDLIVANERTGNRPWRGTLFGLALLPGALSKDEVHSLHDVSRAGQSGSLQRAGAYSLPGPITSSSGVPVTLPYDRAREFAEHAAVDHAFSVLAQFETDHLEQYGPARLVTFSHDTLHRNFDLGQEGGRLVFRVRTPATGLNANDPRAETPPVLTPARPETVVGTFDGAVARIYVNGQLQGRRNLGAATCALPALCDAHLPFARAVLGACTGVIVAACVRRRRWTPARTLLLFALVGGLAALVLHLIDVRAPPDLLAPWTALMALAGALWAGAAVVCADRSVGE